MNSIYNNNIGYPYGFIYPQLNKQQERELLAELFEQLLIFDTVIISTNRVNHALFFLIKNIGINTVERLLGAGYIKFMIWSPVIFSSRGTQLEDGTIDESTIYDRAPIAAGTLSNEDIDPEKNIKNALDNFNIHRDRKRIFTRLAVDKYIVPDGMIFSRESADLVMGAYLNNNLATLGLPFEKDPQKLDLKEREMLLGLGSNVLETAILYKYNLKSYNNHGPLEIYKQNLTNIGNALQVRENTTALLQLEDLPNLKKLYLEERIDFDLIFKLRHLPNAKIYRKWINDVGENSSSKEITKEYLNQIKNKGNFFESSEGKFIKSVSMYGVGSAIGNVLAGPIGTVAGLSLGLLETFGLDSLLKGKKPAFYIDQLKDEIKKKDN